MSYINKTQIF